MKNALAVGLGGFLGALARYFTGIFVLRFIAAPAFPYATLLVNVSGCFLIGLLSGLSENVAPISPPMQLFLMVGLLGGFTTYSAFGYQTVTLAQEGIMSFAVLNVSAHLLLGLGAVFLGQWISKQF
jgi:CrcB protein